MTGYVFDPAHLRPEHPDERRFFNDGVALADGNIPLCIAQALRIWGAVRPGGSYADQCTIMANELLKLAGQKDQWEPVWQVRDHNGWHDQPDEAVARDWGKQGHSVRCLYVKVTP